MKTPRHGEVSIIFKEFNTIVEDTFKNYDKLDLFQTALVDCRGCKKTLKIVIKKSLKFSKPTVPIVYIHGGHALLVYIDQQYKIRGHELVVLNY